MRSPSSCSVALADAFDDPSIEIVYWLDDGEEHWVDARGPAVRAAAGRPRGAG